MIMSTMEKQVILSEAQGSSGQTAISLSLVYTGYLHARVA